MSRPRSANLATARNATPTARPTRPLPGALSIAGLSRPRIEAMVITPAASPQSAGSQFDAPAEKEDRDCAQPGCKGRRGPGPRPQQLAASEEFSVDGVAASPKSRCSGLARTLSAFVGGCLPRGRGSDEDRRRGLGRACRLARQLHRTRRRCGGDAAVAAGVCARGRGGRPLADDRRQ